MSTELKYKTEETRLVEKTLKPSFPNVEAYRFNLASIRVRIIDERFKGKSNPERNDIVDPLLDKLPEKTQGDIIFLLLLARDEMDESMKNEEFENLMARR